VIFCCPNCDFDQEFSTPFKSIRVGDMLSCTNCTTKLVVRSSTATDVKVQKYVAPMIITDKVKKYG